MIHRPVAVAILALLLHAPAAMADVKPLPKDRWPSTVAAAVPLVLAVMSPTQRFIIGDTPKENLFLFRGEWGEDIAHLLGLDAGNNALLQAACSGACPPEKAMLALMEAVWQTLQDNATRAPR